MSKKSTVSLLTDSDEWAYSWLSERKFKNIWMNFQTNFWILCKKFHYIQFKCWDMRNCEKPIWSVRRECDTNQKIQFDISPDKQMLVSGSTSGKLYFWNLGETGGTATELYQKPAHRSAANAVSFHPFAPVIASGSGQRVFPNVADSDSEDTLTATPVSDNALTLWTAFDR